MKLNLRAKFHYSNKVMTKTEFQQQNTYLSSYMIIGSAKELQVAVTQAYKGKWEQFSMAGPKANFDGILGESAPGDLFGAINTDIAGKPITYQKQRPDGSVIMQDDNYGDGSIENNAMRLYDAIRHEHLHSIYKPANGGSHEPGSILQSGMTIKGFDYNSDQERALINVYGTGLRED
jgi:hypothetical protein